MWHLVLSLLLLPPAGRDRSQSGQVLYYACSAGSDSNFAVDFRGSAKDEAQLYDWEKRTFHIHKMREGRTVRYVGESNKGVRVVFYPNPRPGDPTLAIFDITYNCHRVG